MLNALPNFGGVIVGAPFNATGRMSALAADPATPGRLFVGAANGGVWMSTDLSLIHISEPTRPY